MPRHDDQVRTILRVSVTVHNKAEKARRKEKPPVVNDYDYAGLDVWLDAESDFADTNISSAIQQISSQIVSDLAQ